MDDTTKRPDEGEGLLSNEAPPQWETVTPAAVPPAAVPPSVQAGSPQANYLPPQGYVPPAAVPPAAAVPSAQGGYQPVFGGQAAPSYPQYGGPQASAPGYPPPNNPPPSFPQQGYAPQGYPPQQGYPSQSNVGPGYPPPQGYPPNAPPQGTYGAPYGQQGYVPPPQNQYSSPNMADMLAAGVLFGRGRRWQRRPARLDFLADHSGGGDRCEHVAWVHAYAELLANVAARCRSRYTRGVCRRF